MNKVILYKYCTSFALLSFIFFALPSNVNAHCSVKHPHHCLSDIVGESKFGAQPSDYKDIVLGGVNLSPWCKKKFGSHFKAKLIGKTAGDWVCEQSVGNRRPISVTSACKLQYGKKAIESKAMRWSNPYSWKCIGKKLKNWKYGVNLTPWCKSNYGSQFKAKLIGKTAGDWVCEQSAGNRRPISVSSACKLQHGKKRFKKAKAINWNNPYSWKCFYKANLMPYY